MYNAILHAKANPDDDAADLTNLHFGSFRVTLTLRLPNWPNCSALLGSSVARSQFIVVVVQRVRFELRQRRCKIRGSRINRKRRNARQSGRCGGRDDKCEESQDDIRMLTRLFLWMLIWVAIFCDVRTFCPLCHVDRRVVIALRKAGRRKARDNITAPRHWSLNCQVLSCRTASCGIVRGVGSAPC